MDQEDQSDIINKVKSAGNDQPEDPTNDNTDNQELNTSNDNTDEENDDSDIDFSGDLEESKFVEMNNLFINPKKNNMFQPNSNDILKNNLKESVKNSIFDKNKIKKRLQETFNQEDMQNTETVEPMVKPQVQPKTQPITKPTRKNAPFLPEVTPNVQPAPKAKIESVTENEFENGNSAPAEKKENKPKEPQLTVSPEVQKLASELAAYCKNANDMIDKIGIFVKNKNITDSIIVTSILAKTAEIIKNR